MKRSTIILLWLLCGLSLSAQSPIVEEYSFEGMLGDKIPVRITFDVNAENIAAGEIYYPNAKNPAPILIVGERNETSDSYFFREFQGDGTVSGYFSFTLKEKEYADGPVLTEGQWTNPRTENSLDMKRMRAVPAPRSFGNPLEAESPDHIGKEYSYQYWSQRDRSMMGGNVVFRAAGKNRVHFDVSNCPHNMAFGSSSPGLPAVLHGNHFAYSDINECGYGFEAYFFKRFVVLRSITGYETFDCFGMGTTLEGVYIKVKD